MPLKLLQADITAIHSDAVVCAANNYLQYDRFGASGALLRHADSARLEEACRQIGYCATGDAVITPSFGLPCARLIHTVGPVWRGGGHNEETLLRSCYTRSLDLAKEHGLHSVAFPLISAGARGYPREQAISVATSAIGDWLMNSDSDMTVFLTLYREPVGERYREIYSYIKQASPELCSSIRSPASVPDSSPTFDEELSFGLNDSELSHLFEDISSLFKKSSNAADRSAEYNALPPSESFYAEDACADAESSTPFAPPPPLAPPLPPASAPSKSRAPKKSTRRPMRSDECFSESASSRRPSEQSADSRHSARDLMRGDESSEGILSRLRNLMQKSRETFRDMLLRLIDEKGLSDPEVYKRANLDRRLFSKIRSNPDYQPTKNTVLALCIALRLNLDQTADLLRLAGFALSPTSKSDLIIQYFIDREIYNIHAVNEMLFEFGQKLLGAQ